MGKKLSSRCHKFYYSGVFLLWACPKMILIAEPLDGGGGENDGRSIIDDEQEASANQENKRNNVTCHHRS